MLQFRPITLEDKPQAERCLAHVKDLICDYCFADLFIWKDHDDTQICFYKDFMLVKVTPFPKKEPMYLAPIGTGDWKEALDVLEQDAKERGIRFVMCWVTESMKNMMEQIYPERYVFEDNRDIADYIYSADKLMTLSGKKMQSKRNFVNRFKKMYEGRWSYEPITDENEEDAYRFHLQWCGQNGSCPNGAMYSGETCAISLALHNRKALGFHGGILRLDGNVIAFTMGCPISEDTYVVQLEKADASIAGAYPMINQQFAQHTFEGYTYVNREEDLGMEGLRKAKLSYHPVMMRKKYTAVHR